MSAANSARRRRAAEEEVERDWRRRRTLQVKYRGGAEAWWEISVPGRTIRVPGSLCIHDAMLRLAHALREDL